MLRYIARRLLALVPVLVFISFITFTLVRLAPGDPALIMLGGRRTTPETLQLIRDKYQLEANVFVQYGGWVRRAFQGDFGESFRLKQQVSTLIAERAPLTLRLVALSTVLALLVALPLGILAAVYKETWVDAIASLVALIGLSSPVFFTGIIGVLVFSFWLGWLPAFGSATGKGFVEELRFLILPASVLALSMVALNARMTRAAMIEALASEYVEAARARGLPERTIVLKHALRNALIPVVTVAGLQMAFLLVGSVLVEYTFGLGGLGSLITDAIQNRDYPVIQACVLLLAVLFVLVNLVTDLLYAVIDPRVRLA